MTTSSQPATDVVMIALGILFVAGTFLSKGMRGAFGHGTTVPITIAGRIVLFVTGISVFAIGLYRLINN
jgi:hypothetical protein